MKDRMAQAERECLSEIAAQKKGARMTQAQLSHALTDSLLKKKSTKIIKKVNLQPHLVNQPQTPVTRQQLT